MLSYNYSMHESESLLSEVYNNETYQLMKAVQLELGIIVVTVTAVRASRGTTTSQYKCDTMRVVTLAMNT